MFPAETKSHQIFRIQAFQFGQYKTTIFADEHIVEPDLSAAVILPLLTEDERTVYKRGRNSHVNSVPRGATMAEYHAATALEAVFGWLYLGGDADRARELFNEILKSRED